MEVFIVMYTNIVISDVSKYVPENKISNEYFINHFDNEGKDCRGLLRATQRDTRYFADKEESSLSMGVDVVKKILGGIDRNSIDMVIFVSCTPEYTSPSNALQICHEFGLKNAHREFDMNTNCSGMLDALYIATNIMRSDNKVNRTLIVGAEMFSTIVNYHNIPSYTQLADGACAVILDKKVEETQRGFIDYEMRNYTKDIENIVYPKIGMSNVLMARGNNIKNREKRLEWIPFKTDYVSEFWIEMISTIMKRNSVSKDDVVGFCMSQLFPRENEYVLTELKCDLSKYKYVGDKYGYTGNCSPIFALEESDFLEHKDKYIILNSIASGCHFATLLYKN